ncbi:MAG TPA: hydrogenase small subunit [Thermomicrobiaceae bacterium]|nr:hydrogenase small subunit [Thermomicrobiaceae bacterium]
MLPTDTDLRAALRRRGISRRDFLGFCASMAGILALPPQYTGQISRALQQATKPVMVWLEFQDCAGNTESMLRSSHPDIVDLVLDTLSLEYHETIMAGAGAQAEAALQRVVSQEKGKYLVVVEGSIPTADGGVYCTIGGRTALDIAREVCGGAAAVLAVGACAWDGGIPSAGPNPTGAVGIQTAVPGINVVNLGGCPHNAVNTAAVLVHYLTFNELPALDSYNRPLFAYGNLIHDQCERRAHFDAGRFVEVWGDEGHRKGWCLYKMGCKGPATDYNCPRVQWNDGTSWPVKAGHGCIGCAGPRFWDAMDPFYGRLPNVPGFGADITAGQIGLGVTAATAVAFGLHGVGSAIRARIRPEEVTAPETTGPAVSDAQAPLEEE